MSEGNKLPAVEDHNSSCIVSISICSYVPTNRSPFFQPLASSSDDARQLCRVPNKSLQYTILAIAGHDSSSSPVMYDRARATASRPDTLQKSLDCASPITHNSLVDVDLNPPHLNRTDRTNTFIPSFSSGTGTHTRRTCL